MKCLPITAVFLALTLMATGVKADDIIDTDWVEIRTSALADGAEGPNLKFSVIEVVERRAIHSDVLSVIKMVIHAKSKSDRELYFDVDVLARDENGEDLFVMKLSPPLFGLGPGQTALLSQNGYVAPGTLDRAVAYRFRLVGFLVD